MWFHLARNSSNCLRASAVGLRWDLRHIDRPTVFIRSPVCYVIVVVFYNIKEDKLPVRACVLWRIVVGKRLINWLRCYNASIHDIWRRVLTNVRISARIPVSRILLYLLYWYLFSWWISLNYISNCGLIDVVPNDIVVLIIIDLFFLNSRSGQ